MSIILDITQLVEPFGQGRHGRTSEIQKDRLDHMVSQLEQVVKVI